ncbi:hypothetical protein Bbelb_266740 [Branchiostoma belcheri]|nr:hypothetical protein Bbelb_266740 [Branchiostoma belcheri]
MKPPNADAAPLPPWETSLALSATPTEEKPQNGRGYVEENWLRLGRMARRRRNRKLRGIWGAPKIKSTPKCARHRHHVTEEVIFSTYMGHVGLELPRSCGNRAEFGRFGGLWYWQNHGRSYGRRAERSKARESPPT